MPDCGQVAANLVGAVGVKGFLLWLGFDGEPAGPAGSVVSALG